MTTPGARPRVLYFDSVRIRRDGITMHPWGRWCLIIVYYVNRFLGPLEPGIRRW